MDAMKFNCIVCGKECEPLSSIDYVVMCSRECFDKAVELKKQGVIETATKEQREKLQGELDEIRDTIKDIEQRVEQYAQSLEEQGSVELDY